MMFRAVLLASLVACTADADGDGLTNKEEEELGLNPKASDSDGDGLDDGTEQELGTDPLRADMDGDGLLDGEEIELGTDPEVVDTDGDGYTDRDEAHEGSDPVDGADWIYAGGWPYYFEKDDVSNQRGGANMDLGRRFRRFEMVDQHGDMVDLYDFYNEDTYVILDISAEWCPPCRDMAAWLDHQNESFAEFNAVRDAVESGDIHWITIMGEDNSGGQANQELSERWHEAYPTDAIPVLADATYEAVEYAELPHWPFLMLLKPNLRVEVFDGRSWDSLARATEILEGVEKQ